MVRRRERGVAQAVSNDATISMEWRTQALQSSANCSQITQKANNPEGKYPRG